ncbi:MAG: 50S ribosomal protein L21 [Candidatus Paceibacterota bacterium]
MVETTKKASISDGVNFAVIETGGKQYKVAEGDVLSIERLSPLKGGEYKKGDKIAFESVLLTDDGKGTKVGDPYVKGAKVEAEFQEEGRDKKISVIKFRSKSRYFKNKGHRQPYTKVKITKIS